MKGIVNMNLSDRLSVSYYKTIAPINESHKVYLVRHQETGRLFVKKILDIYSIEIYKELQQHPVEGIPRIIAACEEDGKLTVIEEFISGTTLRDKIESAEPPNDPLSVSLIGSYMIQLCDILERLHSLDPPVIHRDIKPSNIMITGFDNIVLLDLNAARYYSGVPDQEADTKLLGTHGYAAPEQYGFMESRPQTDIFSVGRTLKDAVDALPYRDHTFDAVIERCTQMDPSKRYASAGALKTAIKRSLGGGPDKLLRILLITAISAVTLALLFIAVMVVGFFFVPH